jgi:hypothetical protein
MSARVLAEIEQRSVLVRFAQQRTLLSSPVRHENCQQATCRQGNVLSDVSQFTYRKSPSQYPLIRYRVGSAAALKAVLNLVVRELGLR